MCGMSVDISLFTIVKLKRSIKKVYKVCILTIIYIITIGY